MRLPAAGRHRQPGGRRRRHQIREARRASVRRQGELQRRGVHGRGRQRGRGVHRPPGEASTRRGGAELRLGSRFSSPELAPPQLRSGKRAIRIKRAKEPLLLTICSASAASGSGEEEEEEGGDAAVQRLQTVRKAEAGPSMKLDPELYEGVVTQTIIEPTVSEPGRTGGGAASRFLP